MKQYEDEDSALESKGLAKFRKLSKAGGKIKIYTHLVTSYTACSFNITWGKRSSSKVGRPAVLFVFLDLIETKELEESFCVHCARV
jgi:hypothetical protein